MAPHKVYVNRTFDCSAQQLFNWLVRPELIQQWFGPQRFKTNQVNVDLKIGGTYNVELAKPDGGVFCIEGKYLEIDKPLRLVMSMSYRGVPHPPPPSQVAFHLKEQPGGITQLELIQTFDLFPKDMAQRTEAWEHMLEVLGLVI